MVPTCKTTTKIFKNDLRSDVDAFLPADVGISETSASKILFNFGMDSMDKLAKSAVKSSIESLAMASVVKSPEEVEVEEERGETTQELHENDMWNEKQVNFIIMSMYRVVFLTGPPP